MMNKKATLILFLMCLSTVVYSQKVAIKTNLLYGVYAYAPNLGFEFGLSKKSTLDISGSYNPWNLSGKKNNNKKLVHWLGQIEYRYWLCERFSGHFFGLHALGTQFNISGHELPLLFGKGSKNFRHEGYGYGAGISYGYQWVLSNRWSLEANIGVGYARLHYDKYDCPKCSTKISHEVKNYFGPTRAGISFIYVIK